MTVYCGWIGIDRDEIICGKTASAMVIQGCLRFHIREYYVCPTHLNLWMHYQYRNLIRCCGLPVIDYLVVGVDKIKNFPQVVI